ncbi:MAG: glycosyltransferase [Proteobacteria bacterium]|nr:glycosyltransferase [Pseudomonadota bacterium]
MISVVVPLYNKAAHIERALRSIQRQTNEPAEVIVVDDGSTDEGGDIVRHFEMKGLRLISQKNQGVSAARNRGMSEASTDLVAFLDADDEWLPNHLFSFSNLIDRFPDKGLYSTMRFIHDGGGLRGSQSPFVAGCDYCNVEDFFESFAIGLSFVHSSTTLVSKTKALSVGGFPESIRHGEDIILWIKIFLNSGMAHATARTAIYHLDAINRSSAVRQKEPPGSLLYLADLIGGNELPLAFADSAKTLFGKIAFFTAAGMKLSGDMEGVRSIRHLAKKSGDLRLRLALEILQHTPLKVLELARNFRHRPAQIKKDGMSTCLE